jgi:hypothetical protein
MLRLMAWLNEHYVHSLKVLLGVAAGVTLSMLPTALPKMKWASRIPAVITAVAGSAATLLGVLLLIAKLRRPDDLRHLPWLAPGATLVAGSVLCVTAWFLYRAYLRKARQHLQPLIDAALRAAGQPQRPADKQEYIDARTSEGNSVVKELIAAARRRRRPTRLTLLVGAAGAGKSATLREVAARCQAVWADGRAKPVIPVYLDFTDADVLPRDQPLKDYLLAALTGNAQLAAQFVEDWSTSRARATWLIMLDHLDRRFPEQQATPQFTEFVAALDDFLATNRNVRIILSARRMPPLGHGAVVQIREFDRAQRDRFLELRGVSPGYQPTLASEKSFRQYAGNPGWLEFVCPSLMQRPGMVLDNFYEVMQAAVEQRLPTEDSPATGRSRQLAHLVAECAASYLSKAVPPQYAAAREQVIEYIQGRLGESREAIGGALEFLTDHNLMRSWRTHSALGMLAFDHDALLDYFAIARIRQDPAATDVSGLLTDGRQFTVAASVLQHGSAELVDEMLQESVTLLERHMPQPQAPVVTINELLRKTGLSERPMPARAMVIPRWPAVYMVLNVLSAGAQNHDAMLPETIHELADFYVASALVDSTPSAQREMTEVQNLLSVDVAAAVCSKGLRSSSEQLVSTTVDGAISRKEIVDLLSLGNRLRLMLALAAAGLDNSARHDVDKDFSRRLRFAAATGVVTAWLFAIVFGLTSLGELAVHPQSWGTYGLGIILSGVLAGGVVCARKTSRGRKAALERGVVLPYVVYVALACIGSLWLLNTALVFFTLHWGGLLSSIVFTGATLWPVCALYYLAAEAKPVQDGWRVPFVVFAPLVFETLKLYTPSQRHFLPTKRSVFGVIVLMLGLSSLLTIGVVNQKGWHVHGLSYAANTQLRSVLEWVAGITLCASMVVLPFADRLHDRRWYRRWIPPHAGLATDEMLAWLRTQRSPYGLIRVLIDCQRRLPPEARAKAIPVMEDFWRCLKWVQDQNIKRTSPIPADLWATLPLMATDGFANWLKSYDRRHPGRLTALSRRYYERLNKALASLNSHDGPLAKTLLSPAGESVREDPAHA